jgi:aspartate/methionine/tyrosine aminotransferase
VLDPETWKYKADPEDFAKYIRTTAPKVIILVSPDNPTSQVLSGAFVNKALAAAQEVGSFIIMDFAYKELVFDQKYPDYYSWAPNDNFISLRSNSKWCRGLGRRLGWVEAPDFVVKAMETMQGSSILCPDMLHQMAFTTYINNIDSVSLNEYVKDVASGYKLVGDMTVKSIKDYLNYPVLTPKGGLYVCVDVGEPGPQFVERVLKETGVLFVPGWGFGNSMKNAVRVSYGPLYQNYERINEGFMRVKKMLYG